MAETETVQTEATSQPAQLAIIDKSAVENQLREGATPCRRMSIARHWNVSRRRKRLTQVRRVLKRRLTT